VHDENIDYEKARSTFSTPRPLRACVGPTVVDKSAAAVGDLHGRYLVPKQLDLALLSQIREAIDVDISPLGGSGAPGATSKRCPDGSRQDQYQLRTPLCTPYDLERQLGEQPDKQVARKADRTGDPRGPGHRRVEDRCVRGDR